MTAPSSPDDLAGIERSWRRWASLLVVGFVAFSLLLGMIVLPEHDQPDTDLFTAICRALGVPGYEAAPPVPRAPAVAPASDVVWTGDLRRQLGEGKAERGAVVVKDNCAACHGEDGLSTDNDQIPSLASQSAEAMYKELRDFQSGARSSDIMGPPAKALNAQQIADVAAYYERLAPAKIAVAADGVMPEIVQLAKEGDVARGIPGCESCHGVSKSGPEGAPQLVGQPLPYLERQLAAFANASRGNDLFERMRTIARDLTRDEMHRLAIYYSGNPIPAHK
jgi:cytochrome c553